MSIKLSIYDANLLSCFLQTLATCSDQSNEDVSQTPRYLYEPTASIAIWLTLRGVQGTRGCLFLDITIYLHLLALYFRRLSSGYIACLYLLADGGNPQEH